MYFVKPEGNKIYHDNFHRKIIRKTAFNKLNLDVTFG